MEITILQKINEPPDFHHEILDNDLSKGQENAGDTALESTVVEVHHEKRTNCVEK